MVDEDKPCDCGDYEIDLQRCREDSEGCAKKLAECRERLTSLREAKYMQCEEALEQQQNKGAKLQQQITKLTIGGSVAGAVVGKEVLDEVYTTISGVEETINSIAPGTIPPGFVPAPPDGTTSTGEDGQSYRYDASKGEWFAVGDFGGGGFGGGGAGAGSLVGTQARANPEDESAEEEEQEEEQEEEKGKEEEEEAEEEEEEEESEEEEEEEEPEPEQEEEEEEEDESEDESDEESNEEESESESPPSEPQPTQEMTFDMPITTDPETLSEQLADMAAIAADDWIIAETPNLLEALPEILNARQPEPGEVIVGDYQTNDPLPPAVMEEPDVIIEAGIEIPDVMEDVLSPLEPMMIPSTNVLATVLVYFVVRSLWNVRRRRK